MRHSRPVGRVILALAAAAFVVARVAGRVAWRHYEANLGQINFAAETSTVVVDRNGALLRAFTLADGRWRLPATAHEVDPRYLAMLIAYEDGRFYDHRGVDVRALLRAGG